MSYKQESLAQQHRVTDDAIAALMAKYQPGQPTIVFLPGGLASELDVSTTAFAAGNHSYSFDDVWFAGVFFGKLAELGMAGIESLGGKLVIAPRPLTGVYGPFQNWCGQRHYNLLIVAYDWRLRNSESADLLAYALRKLDAAIVQKFGAGEQVADHLCLVAHSLGGIALKLFLNGGGDFVERMRLAVTVCSPFYGYGDSLPWWFNGQRILNGFASPGVVANLIASLPSPYMLPYLDLPTFRANESGFAADKDDPLLDYPLVAAGGGNPVDPYEPPPPPPQRAWYPVWVNEAELQVARTQNRTLTAPLPTAVAAKFHNFRGIQTTEDQIVLRGTINGATWTPIDPGTFNPSDEKNSPIQDKNGPGDDTVPAWSARLLTTPSQNVHTFKEPMDPMHMYMMANPSILAALQALIEPGATVVRPPSAFPPVNSVTSDEAREWLRHLISSPPPNLKTVIRNAAVDDGPARRIFADLLKR